MGGGAPYRELDAATLTTDPLLLQRPTPPTASTEPISPFDMLFTQAVSILACVGARELVLFSTPLPSLDHVLAGKPQLQFLNCVFTRFCQAGAQTGFFIQSATLEIPWGSLASSIDQQIVPRHVISSHVVVVCHPRLA